MTSLAPQTPRFFVVGGSRCGTTSLHAALARHPDVFVPPDKSPNFFTAADLDTIPGSKALKAMKGHTVDSESDYRRLFLAARDDQIVGEVSPVYLQSVFTAARIKSFSPDASIVAIVRNPVDRAFAHFIGRRRDGLEPHSEFAAAIHAELGDPSPKPVAFNNYLAIGRYHHYLRPFFEIFPQDRIKILFFDDLLRDSRMVLDALYTFLGVSPAMQPESLQQKNRGGVIRNPLLRGVWTGTALFRARLRGHLPAWLRDRVGRLFLSALERPELPRGLRPALDDYYADDISDLERLTGRSLASWRSAAKS